MATKKKDAAAPAAVEKETKAKTSRKKESSALEPVVKIQSLSGREIDTADLIDKVAQAAGTDDVVIYVKAEENRAYYIIGGDPENGGSVELWD